MWDSIEKGEKKLVATLKSAEDRVLLLVYELADCYISEPTEKFIQPFKLSFEGLNKELDEQFDTGYQDDGVCTERFELACKLFEENYEEQKRRIIIHL